ncbi:MAG: restriction endonuclease subunit R [Rhizonema sp. PD38]|nr:restriction endonuclease subunit R [Rhizonema sp. PD38]
MATTIDTKNLSLEEVTRIVKFQEQLNNSFASLLSLESLTEFEQQEVSQIRNLFHSYYAAGKISEGQVKFLLLSPLIKLAGFYQPSIRITLEENIADISVEDEDTIIKGRMDILAVNKTLGRTVTTPFWILVIESKNTTVDAMEGLPQLLTYSYKSLQRQTSVWGLTTNGMRYQFVYIQQGNPPTYQLLPDLSLIRPESTIELLQVLKAIRNQYDAAEPGRT